MTWLFRWLLKTPFLPFIPDPWSDPRWQCSARCPNPWAAREKAFKTMQFTKREVYYWFESGLSAATNAVVQGQKSLKQRLLAKFIRHVYAVSSWLKLIGYMFAKQFYWYKLSRAFQLSLCFPLGAYWLAGSRLPDGGGESYHFRGSQNLGPGHLSWYSPWQPHRQEGTGCPLQQGGSVT